MSLWYLLLTYEIMNTRNYELLGTVFWTVIWTAVRCPGGGGGGGVQLAQWGVTVKMENAWWK